MKLFSGDLVEVKFGRFEGVIGVVIGFKGDKVKIATADMDSTLRGVINRHLEEAGLTECTEHFLKDTLIRRGHAGYDPYMDEMCPNWKRKFIERIKIERAHSVHGNLYPSELSKEGPPPIIVVGDYHAPKQSEETLFTRLQKVLLINKYL